MPKPLPEYLTYFLYDCLEGRTWYTTKRMFGGYAIFYEGKIFALYLNDTLYFKVDDKNLQDYLDYESTQFTYKKGWKTIHVCYWQLPEEVLEDKEKLIKWIEKSLAVKK